MCPLLLLVLLFLASTGAALVFELPSGRVKCLTEDLYRGTMSVAHYRVAAAAAGGSSHSSASASSSGDGGGRIAVRLSDPNGESIYHEENVESGNFAFLALESGRYTACFWSPRFEVSGRVQVELDWRMGVAAKDWPSFPKKDSLKAMELELEKLEEWVQGIHEETMFLRQRGDETQRLNESINSDMGWFILSSLFAVGVVAALQYCLLVTFLEREKVL